MSLELVRSYPNRPVWVKYDDWNVCVAIHDAYYIRELSKLRRKLIDNKDNDTFHRIKDDYLKFLSKESYYYWMLGLKPPVNSFKKQYKKPRICRFCGNEISTWRSSYFRYCDINCSTQANKINDRLSWLAEKEKKRCGK